MEGLPLSFTKGIPQIDFKRGYMTRKEAHDYAQAGQFAFTKLHYNQHHMHVFTVHYRHLCL